MYVPVNGSLCDHAGDRVLAGFVDRAALILRTKRLASGIFFVRYADPLPHIRVRVRVVPEEQVKVRRIIERLWARKRNSVCAVESHSRAGELRWSAYEPEYERYGGTVGVAIAERAFVESSLFALASVRRASAGGRQLRLGNAMVAMLICMHAFLRKREAVAQFCGAYAEGYLNVIAKEPSARQELADRFGLAERAQQQSLRRVVATAWEAVASEVQDLPWPASRFRDAQRTVRTQLQHASRCRLLELPTGMSGDTWRAAVKHIMPSLIHMTSNRLGVTIPEEAYLAHLLARALRGESA